MMCVRISPTPDQCTSLLCGVDDSSSRPKRHADADADAETSELTDKSEEEKAQAGA